MGKAYKALFLVLLLRAFPAGAEGQVPPQDVLTGAPATVPRRDFLYQTGNPYPNYAFEGLCCMKNYEGVFPPCVLDLS